MQTNYLSIMPVISKFEIPKGFGVIDKNVQNVATVHMLCTQPAERCNPMTSQWNSPALPPGAVRWDRDVISILCNSMPVTKEMWISRWLLGNRILNTQWRIQGGGGPGGPDPPPFGPRCRLFNIGPKVGPPLL